ncbi:hypothetical protein PMX27_24235, partial [Enterocloster clostridioformis]|nr:hypothetical protein [Enterocloster clostridioformis]
QTDAERRARTRRLIEHGAILESVFPYLYFSRVFKKTTGIPPTEFQQSLLASNTPEWWPDR